MENNKQEEREVEKVKSCSATHRSKIDYFILVGAVAYDCCKEVLHSVHTCSVKIVTFVGCFEAKVVGKNVAVNTVEVYAGCQHVVIDAK